MSIERIRGMQQARQMVAQGKGDAEANQLNQELMQKDSSYHQGAMTTLGQKYGYQLSQWAQQQINDPNSGWSKLTTQQVLQQVDSQTRKLMGGMENDGYFASAAAPIVQHVHNEVAGWSVKMQHDAMGEQMRSNTGAQLGMSAQGGPAFNYGTTFNQYKNYFGGNGALARSTLDQDIMSYARGNLDLKALDNIQPAPGQGALPPMTTQKVEETREQIQKVLKEQNAATTSQQQMDLVMNLTKIQHQGGVVPQSDLDHYVATKQLTGGQATSLYRQGLAVNDTRSARSTALQSLADGQPVSQLVGQHVPGAAPTRNFTQADLQWAGDQYVGAQKTPEAQTAAGIRLMRTQGIMPTAWKDGLNGTTMTTPGGVKQALGVMEQLTNADATAVGQAVSNPARYAMLQTAVTLRQEGQSDEDIATYFQKHDAVKERDTYYKTTSQAVQVELRKRVAGHLFTSVDGSQLSNSGAVASRVANTANLVGATGTVSDPQKIADMSWNIVKSNSYVIKLSDNHSMMLPKSAGDPPPAMTQQALQWFYDKQLPEIAKASGYKGDASDITLSQNPGQFGAFSLVDHTYHPVNNQTYDLNTIVASWHKSVMAQGWHDAQTAQAHAADHRSLDNSMESTAPMAILP